MRDNIENKSRIHNSLRNFVVALAQQTVTLILGFVSRWLFIHVLGASYLGINGLFSNILTVLSMADLGFGSAIVYSMYKPLAEHDEDKLAALIYFYKKVYNLIALVISVIGLTLLPFLKYLVTLDNPVPCLEIYYLLLLGNTVISYLFSYRMCIITADQKSYLLNIFQFIFQIIQFILQIIVLFVLKNYIVYLLIQVICTLANNIYAAHKAKILYPYIIKKIELSKEEKKNIWDNIKSMFLYKIGGVLLNNTDNILVSIMVGTIWVGYYSNYSMIVTYITTFTTIIFTSVNASVGNLSVEKGISYQYKIYKIMDFVAYWIFSFCSICLFVLMSDFIQLMYGIEYRMDITISAIIVLNFYMPGIIRVNSIFRDATGLFKKTKYVFLFTSLINLILSVALGINWGLLGIFLATAIARLMTNVWYEPVVLFRDYFKKKPKEYFSTHLKRDCIVFVTLVITYLLANINRNVTVLNFFYKMLVCIVVPNIFFGVLFYKKDEFVSIKEIVLAKVKIKIK